MDRKNDWLKDKGQMDEWTERQQVKLMVSDRK